MLSQSLLQNRFVYLNESNLLHYQYSKDPIQIFHIYNVLISR